MFRNREEAGILLASKLNKFAHREGIVLAVPRGGIPVAYMVAKNLGLPLDLVLTKKIGHPQNKEYAIGAASLTDYFVLPHEGVTQEYVQEEIRKIRIRLQKMQSLFVGKRKQESLEGKTIIIVDDGIATGNTLLSTVQMLRRANPAKIVVAVPVASLSAVKKLAEKADEVIACLIPWDFLGVGAYYGDFHQVSDEEVLYFLDKFNKEIRKIDQYTHH